MVCGPIGRNCENPGLRSSPLQPDRTFVVLIKSESWLAVLTGCFEKGSLIGELFPLPIWKDCAIGKVIIARGGGSGSEVKLKIERAVAGGCDIINSAIRNLDDTEVGLKRGQVFKTCSLIELRLLKVRCVESLFSGSGSGPCPPETSVI